MLSKVESIGVHQGLLGRLFGFGTIIIGGTGGFEGSLLRNWRPGPSSGARCRNRFPRVRHEVRSAQPAGGDARPRPAALLIEDGRIADVLPHSPLPVSCRIEDVGERVVMPGLVDPHVHINEPGRTAWEGFATATQAAAAGGITTLVATAPALLNSSPVTVTVEAFQQKLAAAAGQLQVDVGFHAGGAGHERDLEPAIQAGVLGAKAFLVHSGIR